MFRVTPAWGDPERRSPVVPDPVRARAWAPVGEWVVAWVVEVAGVWEVVAEAWEVEEEEGWVAGEVWEEEAEVWG
jgi:hypothetical protein